MAQASNAPDPAFQRPARVRRDRGETAIAFPSLPISEVSELLDLTPRTIRHYESLGVIQCLRDARNGRVLERDQIEKLRRIAELRDLGLSLSEINALIEGEADVQARVTARLEQRVRELDQQRARVRAYLEDLQRPIDA